MKYGAEKIAKLSIVSHIEKNSFWVNEANASDNL